MEQSDIRWKQRLENFQKAFSELTEAYLLSKERELSKLEKQGLIQSFEYTHELAWNTLRDFFKDQGSTQLAGSKDVTREAFKVGLIHQGEIWMDMIKSRNLTSHTYNQSTADEINSKIVNDYYSLLKDLIEVLNKRSQSEI